ncbi:MAG: hypothetical protein AB1847_17480 [bacterium]
MKRKKIPTNHTKLLIIKFVQLKSRMYLPDLAKEIGVSYWSLYKILERSFDNYDKEQRNKALRVKVADHLGVAYDDLWGPQNQQRIKVLIEKEINSIVVEQALETQAKLKKSMMPG